MSSGTNGTYDKNGLSSSTVNDGDYTSDPASGGLSSFFVSDYKKYGFIKIYKLIDLISYTDFFK